MRAVLALLLCLLAGSAVAQVPSGARPNFSVTVGSVPVRVTPPGGLGVPTSSLQFWRLWNVSPPGGPTVWCTRFSQTPAPNTAGSYPLRPGDYEQFIGPVIPNTGATWCVSDSVAAPLTAEIW